jgi:hypothetical protein
MKDKKVVNILIFDIITSVVGFLFFMMSKLIIGIFTGNFRKILNYYLKYGPLNIISSILYMCIGLMFSALLLSAFFFIINKFKHRNNMRFYDMYNYATHMMLICVFLVNLFGPFVILIAIGYYMMALKGEDLGAKTGVHASKYLMKN